MRFLAFRQEMQWIWLKWLEPKTHSKLKQNTKPRNGYGKGTLVNNFLSVFRLQAAPAPNKTSMNVPDERANLTKNTMSLVITLAQFAATQHLNLVPEKYFIISALFFCISFISMHQKKHKMKQTVAGWFWME